MDGSRISIGLLAAAAVLTTGCASPHRPGAETSAQTSAVPPAGADASSQGIDQYPSTGHPDPEALREVIAEVRNLQLLDPAAEAELLESLCQTPSYLWPLVVQQFRAAVAYRTQAEAGGAPGGSGVSPGSGVMHGQDARAIPETIAAKAAGNAATASTLPPPALASPSAETPELAAGRQHPATEPHEGPPSDSPTPEAPQGRVVAAAYSPSSSEDWQEHVGEAVRALESSVPARPESSEDIARHACLRMLYLVSGQRDDALQPIPTSNPCTQDFWAKELYGLSTLLDTTLISGPTRRAAEARRHLSEAVARLGELSPLMIRNLAFVTEVQGYGTFEPFETYEFTPGQRVLLYAEVDNFKSDETAEGFHTSLRSSYQIFDTGGRLVAEHEFDTNEEQCRNPRRDFFIGYDFTLPQRIYAGKHVLQLTVEDVNSGKIGQSSIEFAVDVSEN